MNLNVDSPVFPIGVVRRLTGLSDRQIRYYDQTGLVIPERTEGNKRLYSVNEVRKLLEIKELLSRGNDIQQIKDYFTSVDMATEEKSYEPDKKTYLLEKKKQQRLYTSSYFDELIDRLLDK